MASNNNMIPKRVYELSNMESESARSGSPIPGVIDKLEKTGTQSGEADKFNKPENWVMPVDYCFDKTATDPADVDKGSYGIPMSRIAMRSPNGVISNWEKGTDFLVGSCVDISAIEVTNAQKFNVGTISTIEDPAPFFYEAKTGSDHGSDPNDPPVLIYLREAAGVYHVSAEFDVAPKACSSKIIDLTLSCEYHRPASEGNSQGWTAVTEYVLNGSNSYEQKAMLKKTMGSATREMSMAGPDAGSGSSASWTHLHFDFLYRQETHMERSPNPFDYNYVMFFLRGDAERAVYAKATSFSLVKLS